MFDGQPYLHTIEHEVFIYSNRTYVVNEISFWLTRWSRVYREVEFVAFIEAITLLPGDWIGLSYTMAVEFDGSDLEQVSTTRVHSDGYTFTSADVGKRVSILVGDVDWTVGSYRIDSIVSGDAVLESAVGSGTGVAGEWKLGGQQIIEHVDAEILEVKDQGTAGTFRVKCRYVQYTF